MRIWLRIQNCHPITELLLREEMNEVRHSIKSLKTTVIAIVVAVKFHNPLHKLYLHSSTF